MRTLSALLVVAILACSPGEVGVPAGDPSDVGDPTSGDRAGDPVAGDPVSGDPVSGDPVAGDPVAGDPVAGDPIAGDPIGGDPIAGDPGPICPGCDAGEACVAGACQPAAILFGRDGVTPPGTFVCPAGYTEVGRWRTGPGADDDGVEAEDFHAYRVDAGWVWVCSAVPSEIYVQVEADECGSPVVPSCPGQVRGVWHVGSNCSGAAHGIAAGVSVQAGSLRLCVEGSWDVRVEIAGNDCGGGGIGCLGVHSMGSWHTSDTCDSDPSNWGASGGSIQSGWMRLCADADNPLVVDASTLTGKVVAGYQGWFATPNDGSTWDRWVHWFRSQTPAPASATFDLWPDLSEYPASTLEPTNMQYSDGSAVELYSAYHPAVVARHFQWMARYGIDGGFLQRFSNELADPNARAFRDRVALNVMAGAEAHGRVFIIMYDISGTPEDQVVARLTSDWQHLVDDLGVTASDRYLHHDGRPLVAVWGFGFDDRAGTAAQAAQVIDFFHNATEPRYRAAVMGGVPTFWRTGTNDSQSGFYDVYTSFDIVSPWSVGRYADDAGVDTFNTNQIQPDLTALGPLGIDYLPVVWPGFSWANLREDVGLFNQIPRRGGRFLWKQIAEAHASGANMLYVAMFDEVDEATAIYKAATSAVQLPTTGLWLHLSQDGETIPNDLYLRYAGAGAKLLQGQVNADRPLP